MRFLKEENFSVGLFVAVSLLSAVILIGFLVVGKSYLNSELAQLSQEKEGGTSEGGSDIITRDNHHKDPFITRNTRAGEEILQPIVASDSIGFGKEEAPVTIVEFADFECEHCREQGRMIRSLIKEEGYEDKVRLVWKDYPVNDKDSSSWQAAKAARCADKQGKFWDYHDELYKGSDDLGEDLFLELARELGLDTGSFAECLAEGEEIDERIEGNITEANILGINGIPFLYINDREFMGEIDKKELEQIIQLELNE